MPSASDAQPRWMTLVGIGEDGIEALGPRARAAISEATLVVGGRRHLDLAGSLIRGEGLAWRSPIELTFPTLLARRPDPVCVLASGDPFHYGIGATLARLVPPSEMESLPQPSSFSLAASRLGWALQDTLCLSLHGRALGRVVPHLRPGTRLIALSWDGSTPERLAAALTQRGFGPSRMCVLEAMGGPHERRRSFCAEAFDGEPSQDLNLVAVEVVAAEGTRVRPLTPGLPDGWFEHDGQITKAPIRALTLAALAPKPGQVLWDVGAGSGSVSIEWLLQDPSLLAVAFEQDSARVARIDRNAEGFGVLDRLDIRVGSAPAQLPADATPDAIFIGGGLTSDGLLTRCRDALRPGGVLVANAVTLESQARLSQCHGEAGGQLSTITIATAEPVGRFHGLRPAMTVMQWRWVKP